MKTKMKNLIKNNNMQSNKIWLITVQLIVLSLFLVLSQLTLAKDRIQYHVQNFDGSTLKVINEQGVVSQSYQYAPFGQQLQYKKPSNLKNPNAFVGGVQDAGDLVYLKARHYNPVLGRFYQPDPVTYIMKGHGQTNRYQYGWNDSYSFRDPDGKLTVYFGGAGLNGNYIKDQVEAFMLSNIKNVFAGPIEYSIGGLGEWMIDGPMTIRMRYGYNNNLNMNISLPEYMVKNSQNEQFNLIGYSYGSIVAADLASYYSKINTKIDNLVLIGSPISSSYLERLSNDSNIKNIIIVNLTKHGDPIYAGMGVIELIANVGKLAEQKKIGGIGHFYYEPNTPEVAQRRRDLANYLYQQGLR